MSMNRIFIASLLSGAMLLAACQAQPPADQVADAAAANDVVAAPVEAPATAEDATTPAADETAGNPLAVELFTLVGDSVCAKQCPQYDARVDKAYTSLLADAASLGDARLRERIGSGPQPVGERVQTAAGERWLYRACQAHQCSTTALAALYDPEVGSMVGRLLYRCEVVWLGSPSSADMDEISRAAPVSYSDTNYSVGCTGN